MYSGMHPRTKVVPIPHFRCVSCKARSYSAGKPSDLIDDQCPDCGTPLEPVGQLDELVGFRLINSPGSAAEAVAVRLPEVNA